jgi:hypothetical protein
MNDQEAYDMALKSLPQQGSRGMYTESNGVILLNGIPVGVHGFSGSKHAWELFH